MNKGFQQGITLRHLRALVALSDLKLIARVSEALGVTQPAVSKQIAELEKIVGVPVVTRDRNRLYLTPIGIRLTDHARQALGQLDRAAFDIEAMTSGISGFRMTTRAIMTFVLQFLFLWLRLCCCLAGHCQVVFGF